MTSRVNMVPRQHVIMHHYFLLSLWSTFMFDSVARTPTNVLDGELCNKSWLFSWNVFAKSFILNVWQGSEYAYHNLDVDVPN